MNLDALSRRFSKKARYNAHSYRMTASRVFEFGEILNVVALRI